MIKRIKNKEWKRLSEDISLPDNLKVILDNNDVFRSYHGEYFNDMIWYKGENSDVATAWTFIMDDGGYYKVHAKYSFWHTNANGNLSMQCVWSDKHLVKTVRNYLETGETLFDPQYQT